MATTLRVLATITLLALVSAPARSRAQDGHPLDPLRAMWRAGDYEGAAPRLVDYRKLPNGRTAEVDYLIGTCACRLAGQADFGRRWLAKVLHDYRLSPEQDRVVRAELLRCGSSDRPTVVPVTVAWGQSFVEGKTFYWAGRNNALASAPATTVREIPYAQIAARRFPMARQDDAVREIGRLAGPGFVVVAQAPFVLASGVGHTRDDLAVMGQLLERFHGFFTSEYDMGPAGPLITAYLVRDTSELRRLAERLHGLRISSSTIAYNYSDDRSLAAVIPSHQIGSLGHELFHLLAHERFGDIPAWLDEGLAALYEVSVLRSDGRVAGIDNWRRRALQDVWNVRPSISRLVRMSSTEFENQPNDFELRRQAANHAVARYLMLYLQEQGQLVALYRAFRDRDPQASASAPADQAVGLVQAILGRPIAAIDQDFERWFQAGPRPAPEGTPVDKWLPPPLR